MKLNITILFLAVFALAGCVTGGPDRGHIVMKTSDDTAHVALGSGAVKVGDHVELYHNECAGGGGIKSDGELRHCKKVSTGHGDVIELYDADYSVVKFPKGTKFSEGDTIEKHRH